MKRTNERPTERTTNNEKWKREHKFATAPILNDLQTINKRAHGIGMCVCSVSMKHV